MFGTLLNKLDGLFSASFWIGSYMPVLVVAALNALLISWVDPKLDIFQFFDGDSKIAHSAAAAFGVFLLAYLIAPLTPAFTRILDGSVFPNWLKSWLRKPYTEMAKQAGRDIDPLKLQFRNFKGIDGQGTIKELQQARQQGNDLAAITDVGAIRQAEQSIFDLKEACDDRQVPEIEVADTAIRDLKIALIRNSTRVAPNSLHAEEAPLLDRLHQCLVVTLLPRCTTNAQEKLERAVENWRWRVDLSNPQPTRFGNIQSIVQSYSLKVYNVDFDYLWPRLQSQLPANSGQIDALTAARAQVDFWVLVLALLSLSWAGWLIVLPILRIGAIPFLVVAVASPILMLFAYRLATAAETEFGGILNANIDRYRLDVLKMLNLPRPSTLFAERELWDRLQRAQEAPKITHIAYHYK